MWQLSCVVKALGAKPAPQTVPLVGQSSAGPCDQPPPLPPDNPRTRLRREFSVLGFLGDRHPMEVFTNQLSKQRTIQVVDLPRFIGRRVRLAGWLITGKVVSTKNGDPMEFLTFEDQTGIVETTFFPQAYRRFCHMIDRNRPYLLTGRVAEDWGAVTLTVDSVESIKRDVCNNLGR
jgi:DNA polymerase-3 subunit alpha/error-prone DNA polymerase